MIWVYVFGALLAVYLALGLLIGFLRARQHFMSWPVFVFTVLFWPTLWMPD